MKKRITPILLSAVLTLGSIAAVSSYTLTSCNTSSRALVVDTMPIKTSYKVGETLDLGGLNVISYKVEGGLITKKDGIVVEDYETSIKNGTKLENEGEFEVVIKKSGSKSTSFKIYVGEQILTTKLKVQALPSKVTYKVGEKFKLNGLIVTKATYNENGVQVGGSTPVNEYVTNPASGYTFTKEGSYIITISKEGCESASFTVSVQTGDLRLLNMMTRLQGSTNYTLDIYNTIPTTIDQFGFHYENIYTENYYLKTTYSKFQADEPENDRYMSIKSTAGAISYDEGAYEYELVDEVIKAKKPISYKNNWWDAGIYSSFKNYDFTDCLTTSKDGKFTFYVQIDPLDLEVPYEERMYTETAKKNPFVASFLNLAGWSSSLIGIMNRLEVTTDGYNTLNMKAYMGSYGYTEIKLVEDSIGNSYNSTLEEYVLDETRTYDRTLDEEISNGRLRNTFLSKSYDQKLTQLSLTDGTAVDTGVVHFTPDYVMFDYSEQYLSFLTDNSGNRVYGDINVGFYYSDEALNVPNSREKGMYSFVNENMYIPGEKNEITEMDENNFNFAGVMPNGRDSFYAQSFTDVLTTQVTQTEFNYKYPHLTFGELLDPKNPKAASWSKHPLLSSSTSKFLVSYDLDVIAQIGLYIVGPEFTLDILENNNLNSACLSYSFIETSEGIEITAAEAWLFDPNYYGMFVSFGNIGHSNVDYVDSFIEGLKAQSIQK